MHWRKRKKCRRLAKSHGFTHYYNYKKYMRLRSMLSKEFVAQVSEEYEHVLLNIPDIPILVKQHIPIYDKEIIPQEKAQWTHEDSVREAKDLLKSISTPFFDDIVQSKTKERNDYIDSLADEELIRLATLVANSIVSSLDNNPDSPLFEEKEE
jgi:hypothetical protein